MEKESHIYHKLIICIPFLPLANLNHLIIWKLGITRCNKKQSFVNNERTFTSKNRILIRCKKNLASISTQISIELFSSTFKFLTSQKSI